MPYDFALKTSYLNIIVRARNLKDDKAKIETINSKAKGIDRFDLARELRHANLEIEPTCVYPAFSFLEDKNSS